jgi:hypothetical protein
MTLYSVWQVHTGIMGNPIKDPEKAKKSNSGTGVGEKCLMTDKGHYVGVESGKFYEKKFHYHSPNLKARVVNVDGENLTGMYHLSEGELFPDAEENEATWKRKYLGAIITVREAHWAGEHRIYRCIELDEYFSDRELEILES